MGDSSNIFPRTSVTGNITTTGVVALKAASAKYFNVLKKLVVNMDPTVSAASFKVQEGSTDILEVQDMVGPDKWSEDLELRCSAYNTALNLNIVSLTGGVGTYYAELEQRPG